MELSRAFDRVEPPMSIQTMEKNQLSESTVFTSNLKLLIARDDVSPSHDIITQKRNIICTGTRTDRDI